MSPFQQLGTVVMCAIAFAAGAAGQSCVYGEAASADCQSPRVIGGGVGQHVVLMDCFDATGEGYFAGIHVGNIVYFQVTPTVSGPMLISTCHPNTLYDTVVSLCRPTGVCTYEELDVNDDAFSTWCTPHCTGYPSEIAFDVTAGTTYVIRVGSYDANPDGCWLCLGLVVTIGEPCGEAPRGFACAVAEVIPPTPGSYYYTFDTQDAIGSESWSCQSSVGHILWFQITPAVSGDLFVNTCRTGTNYDTVIRALEYSGEPCDSVAAFRGCQDDPGCAFLSTAAHLTMAVTAGVSYVIEVAGYSTYSGCLDLEFTFTEELPGACCFAYGRCEEYMQETCASEDGVWQGAGTECYPNPCPDPCAAESTPPITGITLPVGLGAGCACEDGGRVIISGAAYDPDGTFAQYVVEYRPASGGGWQTIASSSAPVGGGQLAAWNTAGVAEGYYVLRLTATNYCGMASTAVQVVYLGKSFDTIEIDYPPQGGVVAGLVCLDGSVVDGWCFESFTAEYRSAGGGTWTPVDSREPVYYSTYLNETFAVWDTDGGAPTVPDGSYVLRVTGRTTCGQSLTRERSVVVDNSLPIAQITQPGSCDDVEGVVTVRGTALDAHLSRWSLYYTGGSTNYWVQIASGTTSVVDGVLGTWNTSALPPCAYTLRLVVWDTAVQGCNGLVHESEYDLSVTKGLGSAAAPGDINCDGAVNVFDIDPFVRCLTTGDCDCP